MTALDPLARVREMRERHIYEEHDFDTEGKICDELKTFSALEAVLAIHKQFGIYDACGHEHTDEEADDPNSDVLFIDEIGNTCKSALLYYVCKECCCDGSDEGNLTEECTDHHLHEKEDVFLCNTRSAISQAWEGRG